MRIGRLIFRVVLTIIVIVPLAWFCLTAFEPEVILYQAQRIAGERPYCIVVADTNHPFRYKEIKNRNDLTYSALAVHMDWGGSSGPFAETYYSLLILKDPNEVRNWSKRYLNFESDVIPTQTSLYRMDLGKLCTPAVNFAKLVP
jgi:hypothetical protein